MILFTSLWYYSRHYYIIQRRYDIIQCRYDIIQRRYDIIQRRYDIIQVVMILFVVLPWPISFCFQYCNKVLKTLCQMFSMILSTFTYDIITTHVWYYSWSGVILFTVDQLLVNVKCATIHCLAMILIFLLYDILKV